jgi:sugar/nucleoside kinase (ribokinase family)
VICAVGNPVFDDIRTPWVKTDGRILSGCSTNAALAYAKLGGNVAMVGNVGDDQRKRLEQSLSDAGIVYHLGRSLQSGGFKLEYDDAGHRDLSLLGVADPIAEFPADYYDRDAILIGPILQETSHEFIRSLRERYNGVMFLDPQGLLRRQTDGVIDHYRPDGIEEIIGMFDYVKPNELETEVLTGIDPRKDVRSAAKKIKSWGPDVVIITLAEAGSVIYDGSAFIDIPPYVTHAADPTGAGDTYAGGFLFARLSGADLEFSGRFASCTASVMIEHTGPGFPLTRDEVGQRMEKLPGPAMSAKDESALRSDVCDGR